MEQYVARARRGWFGKGLLELEREALKKELSARYEAGLRARREAEARNEDLDRARREAEARDKNERRQESDNAARQTAKMARLELPLLEWTVKDACTWIDDVGLTHLALTFADNGVDGRVLASLMPHEYADIGISAIVDRKKFEVEHQNLLRRKGSLVSVLLSNLIKASTGFWLGISLASVCIILGIMGYYVSVFVVTVMAIAATMLFITPGRK